MRKAIGSKRFLAAATSVTMVATAFPLHEVNASEKQFQDVKEGTFYAEAVNTLKKRGIVNGYLDGTFRPDQALTRAEAAHMIASSLQILGANTSNRNFKDVKGGDWYYHAVMALADAKIMIGKTMDTFAPDDYISRAELAKVISLSFNLAENTSAAKLYKDVSGDSWYSGYVGALIENRITSGVTSTTFAPERKATRGQLATFIHRAEHSRKKIENLSANSITINGKEYKFESSLSTIFNEANEAVLLSSLIEFEEKDNVIQSITYLELIQSGSEHKELVFDAKNGVIQGNVKLRGDYLSIKNLTVKGDLEIGDDVRNQFSSDQLVVEGGAMIGSNRDASSVQAATLLNLTINPHNSNIPMLYVNSGVVSSAVNINPSGTTKIDEIQLRRDAVIYPSQQVQLGEISILPGASAVELHGGIPQVLVNTDFPVRVLGKAEIEKMVIQKSEQIILEIQGRIKELHAENTRVLELRQQMAIDNFLSQSGLNPADIIRDYEQVKRNIGRINGVPNPDAPRIPVPTVPTMPAPDPDQGQEPNPDEGEDQERPTLVPQEPIISIDSDGNDLIDHILVGFQESLKGATLNLENQYVQVEGYEVTSAKTMPQEDICPIIFGEQMLTNINELDVDVPIQLWEPSKDWEGTGSEGDVLVITIQEDGEQIVTPTVTISPNVLEDLAGNYFAGVDNMESFYFDFWSEGPCVPPAKSMTLETEVSEDSITLNWDNTKGYNDIRIKFDGQEVYPVAGSSTFTIEELLPGMTYDIRVEFRMQGNDSPQAVGEVVITTNGTSLFTEISNISSGAMMGYYQLGKWYVYAGIIPNKEYQVSGRLVDKDGNPVTSGSNVTMTIEPKHAEGIISNVTVHEDGTFEFIYTSGAHGSTENNDQDDFDIFLNGYRTSAFWTNSY